MEIMNKIILPDKWNKQLWTIREDILESLKNISDKEIKAVWTELDEIDKKSFETSKVPVRLQSYRRNWLNWITNISQRSKNKIHKVAGNISHKVELCDDWSILSTIKIGDKTYKIIDVDLKAHTNKRYLYPHPLIPNNPQTVYDYKRASVMLWWMLWDDIKNWKNEILREYALEQEKKWFKMVNVDEMRKFLKELWKKAKLSKEEDTMALLMYLTGMENIYWLCMQSNWDPTTRDQIFLGKKTRAFTSWHSEYSWAGFFMMACEKN